MKRIIDIPEELMVEITRVGLLRMSDKKIGVVDKAIQLGEPLDHTIEKLRKARKEAKRWKRKYSEMRQMVEKSAEVLDYSDKNGLHVSYPAWTIAHRLGKALEPYLLERLKGE